MKVFFFSSFRLSNGIEKSKKKTSLFVNRAPQTGNSLKIFSGLKNVELCTGDGA
jgi:hypothetical protein